MMGELKLKEKEKQEEKEIANLEELKKLIESFKGLEHLHSFFRYEDQ
jgi:hypothetical protein